MLNVAEKSFLGASTSLNEVCMVYPLTINEIIGLGQDQYNAYLNLLTMTESDIEFYFEEKIRKNPELRKPEYKSVFDYLMRSCENNDTFLLDLQKAFFTFIREQVQILPELNMVVVGKPSKKRIIDEKLFFDFQNILRLQNKIPLEEPIPENENPMQRKFRLRRAALKDAKKRQKKDDNTANFYELMSSLCCFNVGVTPFDVGKLTLFAFYELLNRAGEKEKFESDCAALRAGADSKKIKPKYWIRSLEE